MLERVLRASVLASTNPVEAAAAEALRNLSRAAAAGLSVKEIDGVFDDLLRGLRAKRAENASPPSAESTKVLTADGARVATVVDGAHATAVPPAEPEPSPAEPSVVKDAPAAAGLAALYEATVEVAEAHKDDDGVGLGARRLRPRAPS